MQGPCSSSYMKEKKTGEKLKGSLLKGSLDKACALTCRLLCRSLPHTPPSPPPSPFSLLSTGKPPPTTHLNPTTDPSPKDTNRNSHPFAKTIPGKSYPLVSARKKTEKFPIENRGKPKTRRHQKGDNDNFCLEALDATSEVPKLFTVGNRTATRRVQ